MRNDSNLNCIIIQKGIIYTQHLNLTCEAFSNKLSYIFYQSITTTHAYLYASLKYFYNNIYIQIY